MTSTMYLHNSICITHLCFENFLTVNLRRFFALLSLINRQNAAPPGKYLHRFRLDYTDGFLVHSNVVAKN